MCHWRFWSEDAQTLKLRFHQSDRILGKVTFGQNRNAPHTLYYKYKPNYLPILHVLPAWLDSPLRLRLVMPLHIHNAAATEAAPSVDVFKRSTTRRDS